MQNSPFGSTNSYSRVLNSLKVPHLEAVTESTLYIAQEPVQKLLRKTELHVSLCTACVQYLDCLVQPAHASSDDRDEVTMPCLYGGRNDGLAPSILCFNHRN